jgi:HPt (histidine-containing phosphotransfer) domain-containing protein
MIDDDFDEKNESMLAVIWQRHRPVVQERLQLLDRVVIAAKGELSDDLREEGSSVAHKLAGSLGMYGYDEGTRVAREIEHLLLDEPWPDTTQLGHLVAALRRAVFPVI